ncbi:hypothetical protein HHI36_017373, partial [Cryptolaemus montrouzieri]
ISKAKKDAYKRNLNPPSIWISTGKLEIILFGPYVERRRLTIPTTITAEELGNFFVQSLPSPEGTATSFGIVQSQEYPNHQNSKQSLKRRLKSCLDLLDLMLKVGIR